MSGSVPAPQRDVPPCDPPLPSEETEFQDPNAAPEGPGDLLDPGPLLVLSKEAVATCSEDYRYPDSAFPEVGGERLPDYPAPVGDDVVLPEGAVSREFRFQALGLFDASKLSFIAKKISENSSAVSQALKSGSGQVRDLLRITAQEADQVVEAYSEIQELVDGLAFERASASLSCLWLSQRQEVSCEGEAFLTEEYGDASNPVVIEAEARSSPVSQEAADFLAKAAAESALGCFYPSPQVIVECPGDLAPGQDGPGDFGPLPVWDKENPGDFVVPFGPRQLINRVVVEEGAFVSRFSEEDARSRAEAAATSDLNCQYFNPPLQVSCETQDSPGDYIAGEPGDVIDVPVGAATSDISWEDAEQLATTLGEGLLFCPVCSDFVRVTCPDLPVELTHYSELAGEDITVIEKPDESPAYTVELSECAVTLPRGSDKQVANDAALQLALIQLECWYCAPAVERKCGETSTDPNTGTTSSSLDRTRGVGLNEICGSDPISIVQRVDAIGLTPALLGEDSEICTFGNERLVVNCAEVSSRLNLVETYNAWDQEEVEIARSSFFAGSLSAANEAAFTVASTILNCRYRVEKELCCPVGEPFVPPSVGDTDEEYLFRGDDRSEDSFGNPIRGKDPEPDGPEVNYELPIWRIERDENGVPVDEIIAVAPCASAFGESYSSTADAAEIALTIARGRLKCPYTNHERRTPPNPCPPGMESSLNETIIVRPGAVVSEWGSSRQANIIAEGLVAPMLECYIPYGGMIDLAQGKVHGGSGQAGKMCGGGCAAQPGDKVKFNPLPITKEPATYYLCVSCEGNQLAATVKKAPLEDADLVIAADDCHTAVILGTVEESTEDGITVYNTVQEAMGLIQIENCSDDNKGDDFELRNYTIDKDTKICTAEITPGYVVGINPDSNGDPVSYHMPTAGGIFLNNLLPPTVTFPPNYMVGLEVRRDGKGLVLSARIVVEPDPYAGEHYQPSDPLQSAEEGRLVFKIATLESNPATPSGFDVKSWHDGGPIIVWPTLWTGENLGGGAGVYKKRNRPSDTYQFRSISGRGSFIRSSGDDADVTQQINIVQDGDVIRTLGNGNVARLTVTPFGGSAEELITWSDGLIENSEDVNIDLPSPGGGGSVLPPGQYDGDMLYWNAPTSEWILLSQQDVPANDEIIILTHNGTKPEWKKYETINVDLCINGVVQSKDIIIM